MNLRTILDYQKMMEDPVRMQAYQAAIRQTCPGAVVCEVGVGLGPLSLMALNAGASKVYGIEANVSVLEVATRIIRAAGYDESRFVPIAGLSHRIDLPERVDVILSETLDSTGLGENTAFAMEDAAKRFLKRDGKMVPSHLGCAVAPAFCQAYDDREAFWRRTLPDVYGLDYSGMAHAMRTIDHHLLVRPDEVHGPWQMWQEIQLGRAASMCKTSRVQLPIERAGTITGLAAAFVAVLTPEQLLSTFPEQPATHWQQGFLPLSEPLEVEPGDVLHATLTTPDSRRLTLKVERDVRLVRACAAGPVPARLGSAL